MSPSNVLITAAALGAYVVCGGAFGTCYTLGQSQGRHVCARLAPAFYAFQVVFAIGIVEFTPLAAGWKVLIACSTVAYAAVPPVTLRYLRGLEGDSEGR